MNVKLYFFAGEVRLWTGKHQYYNSGLLNNSLIQSVEEYDLWYLSCGFIQLQPSHRSFTSFLSHHKFSSWSYPEQTAGELQMISYHYVPGVTVTVVFTEAEMSSLLIEANSPWAWEHLPTRGLERINEVQATSISGPEGAFPQLFELISSKLFSGWTKSSLKKCSADLCGERRWWLSKACNVH